MSEIIIAVDEQDAALGHYFEQSKQYLYDYLIDSKNTLPVTIVGSNNCHQTYVDLLVENAKKPLVFIAYSHGLPNSLRCNSAAYLSSDNIQPLLTSFIYAISCYSAKELGQTFKEQQGVYIGFKDEIQGFTGVYLQKCVQCDNSGMMYALENPRASLKEAYKAMKNRYNETIDYLEGIGAETLHIAYFREMRDALTFIGNPNLRIADF